MVTTAVVTCRLAAIRQVTACRNPRKGTPRRRDGGTWRRQTVTRQVMAPPQDRRTDRPGVATWARVSNQPPARHHPAVPGSRSATRSLPTCPPVSVSHLAAIRQVMADDAHMARRSPVPRSRALWPVPPASRRSRLAAIRQVMPHRRPRGPRQPGGFSTGPGVPASEFCRWPGSLGPPRLRPAAPPQVSRCRASLFEFHRDDVVPGIVFAAQGETPPVERARGRDGDLEVPGRVELFVIGVGPAGDT